MSASAEDILRALHVRYTQIFDQTLAEPTDHGHRATAVQNIADLGACIAAVAERPEKSVFDLSVREYQYALVAACHGSYRQAFAALRLSFELWLAAINFSGSERELRSWRAKKKDIVWAQLIDDETGVLSKTFVSLFATSLVDHAPSYRAIAERLYRECSEYVHGNHHTHLLLPEDLTYDQATFRDWCSKAQTLKLVCLFCFTFRYSEKIAGTKLVAIGSPIGDALGHIPEVRQLTS